jgi:hypothetical protein
MPGQERADYIFDDKDLPHDMPTTHAEIINAELLTFLKAMAGLVVLIDQAEL